jgi:hypothetical protein
MTSNSDETVDYQLGQLGVAWAQAKRYKGDAMDIAAGQHKMGAQGKIALFDVDGKLTGKRLVYDCGIDGRDGKFWIEDIPSVQLDWEMSEEEWEELRSVLRANADDNHPYLHKLFLAGKLGEYPATPMPQSAHRVCSDPASRPGTHCYLCSCGHRFISLGHGRLLCPLDPDYRVCR